MIENIKGEIKEIPVGKEKETIFIPEKRKDTSWIVSPYHHYITTSKEELDKIKNPMMKFIFNLIIYVMKILFKIGNIDKSIYVNEHFFSTNPKKNYKKEELKNLVHTLKKTRGNEAFIIRSLDEKTCEKEINLLKKEHFDIILSRQIYLFDSKEKTENKKSRKIKKDSSLLYSGEFSINEEYSLNEKEWERIEELYKGIYIEKYSNYNPKYTKDYFKSSTRNKNISYAIIRKEGKIVGFIGFFVKEKIIYSPFLGYDRNFDKEKGLYRMLFIYLTEKAKNENLIFHQSAGASEFKRQRGAKSYFEYMAVYTKHLPIHRRIVWKTLKFITNKLVAPYLKKEKL